MKIGNEMQSLRLRACQSACCANWVFLRLWSAVCGWEQEVLVAGFWVWEERRADTELGGGRSRVTGCVIMLVVTKCHAL